MLEADKLICQIMMTLFQRVIYVMGFLNYALTKLLLLPILLIDSLAHLNYNSVTWVNMVTIYHKCESVFKLNDKDLFHNKNRFTSFRSHTF